MSPPLLAPALQPLVALAASQISWDPLRLTAQILVESSGDPWAFRYEPAFYARYLRDNPAWVRRGYGPLAACSYGLLQLLFATAVEDGYGGHPEGLFDPRTNLYWACRHLSRLREWALDDPLAVLAAYNGGQAGNATPPYRNQAYVDRVLAEEQRLRGGGIPA